MGVAALMVADCLPMDHYIRQVPPALSDTIWMSIHVPIIMVSYAVLALGVVVAHAQLLVMAFAPTQRDFSKAMDTLHYGYIAAGSVLLAAGIMTGSMWASCSWGRYWGWDPKEVWSLVALLASLSLLHVRLDQTPHGPWGQVVLAVVALVMLVVILLPFGQPVGPNLEVGIPIIVGIIVILAFFVTAKGPFAIAVKSILAFWTIIMTYVGVNYVLGTGLHNYGFGPGAVAVWMILMAGADLLFVVATATLYGVNQRRNLRIS
jgi:ABC-type transport system involved in cytochrome c biogenesis permease subunit